MSEYVEHENPSLLKMHGAIWGSIAGVMVLVTTLTGAAYWAGGANTHEDALDGRMTALEQKLDHVNDAVQTKLDSLNDKLTDLDVSVARIEGDRRVPPHTP